MMVVKVLMMVDLAKGELGLVPRMLDPIEVALGLMQVELDRVEVVVLDLELLSLHTELKILLGAELESNVSVWRSLL